MYCTVANIKFHLYLFIPLNPTLLKTLSSDGKYILNMARVKCIPLNIFSVASWGTIAYKGNDIQLGHVCIWQLSPPDGDREPALIYFSPVNTDLFLYMWGFSDLRWPASSLKKNTFGRFFLCAACDFHLSACGAL